MKVRVKETGEAVYITVLFEADRIPYQASITVYPTRVNCEIVPPGFAAKEFVDKLMKALGAPVEGPRVRSSHSDCGEETGSLLVSFKGEEGIEGWLRRLRSIIDLES